MGKLGFGAIIKGFAQNITAKFLQVTNQAAEVIKMM